MKLVYRTNFCRTPEVTKDDDIKSECAQVNQSPALNILSTKVIGSKCPLKVLKVK